jgi:methyl-accepting chemotaxis protein
VKNLEGQTARATDDIAARIEQIRRETDASVSAVREIIARVRAVDQLAATIATAVGQQLAATQEISRTVNESAAASREVTARIAEVSATAVDAGAQAAKVGGDVETLVRRVGRLRTELTRVVRTAVGEVDRRAEPRQETAAKARLRHAGGEATLRLIEVSPGGFAAEADMELAVGMSATLLVGDRAEARCTMVSRNGSRFGFRFDDPEAAAPAVAQLGAGLKRAA